MSAATPISELHARYLANVDWADEPNFEKAKVFRSAVMSILAIRPTEIRKGAASQLSFDPIQLQKQLNEVNKFIAASNTSENEEKIYFDIRRFRQ